MSEIYHHRAHQYRLYPTPAQAERLASWVGAVRLTYNLALEQRQTFWRPGRRFNYVTQGLELGELRASAPWLADVPRVAMEQALRDLDRAYQNWWSGRARAPTFRRRGANDSLRVRGGEIRVERRSRRAGVVRIPKIGEIPIRWDAPIAGEIRSITITRRVEQWFAVVAYRVSAAHLPQSDLPPVGLDRGIAVFAALSSGAHVNGPNVGRKASASLARAQRRLARKVKGSQNYRKQRLRVARLHARVSAARKDFLHKTSTTIAKSHGLVVMEDLKVRNMTKSASGTIKAPGRNVRQKAGLNRAILDQGWGMFREMLAYKLEERGGHLLMVDPRDTSRTCAECGVVDADSREGVRFSCRSCGHEAHADTNAAINILRRGTPLMPVEVASASGEAGTGSGAIPGDPQGGCRQRDIER